MEKFELPATVENCFRCLCDSKSVPILPAEIALDPPIFYKPPVLPGEAGSVYANAGLVLRSLPPNF